MKGDRFHTINSGLPAQMVEQEAAVRGEATNERQPTTVGLL